MPLRTFRCKDCGVEDDKLYWKEYPKSIPCSSCGGKMDYRFGSALYRMEFRSGFDTSAGEYFYSRRDRDNWLKKNRRTKVKI